jgi:hypothetical protein
VAAGGSFDETVVPVDLPKGAVVVRFRPTAPDRVFASAEAEHDRTGRYGLSVFADAPQSGEDKAAVVQRLLAVAETEGMEADRHPKYYVCADGNDLDGYAFYKTVDDQVAEHLNIDLGAAATVADVPVLLDRFTEMRR